MRFVSRRRSEFAVLATIVSLVIAFAPAAVAQQASSARGPTKQMQPADLKAWKSIRQAVLSNDGRWFTYVLAPNEGDATLIVKSTGTDGKETSYPIGSAPAGGGFGGGGQSVAISGDSKWLHRRRTRRDAAAGRVAAARPRRPQRRRRTRWDS